MPTNKQDKRDGPTTEEQEPHPGTPNPCTLLPLLPLFFSISLYLSRSLSMTLSHISPLILQHSVSLYFLLFYPLQHVSHLNPSADKLRWRLSGSNDTLKKRQLGEWKSWKARFFFRLLTNTKLSQHGLNPYSNVMIKCGVFSPPLLWSVGGVDVWWCDDSGGHRCLAKQQHQRRLAVWVKLKRGGYLG